MQVFELQHASLADKLKNLLLHMRDHVSHWYPSLVSVTQLTVIIVLLLFVLEYFVMFNAMFTKQYKSCTSASEVGCLILSTSPCFIQKSQPDDLFHLIQEYKSK